MIKRMKRPANVRSLLLMAAGLGLVLVAAGSSVYAASPADAATSFSVRPVTILDPFTLSTIPVSNPQPSAKALVPTVSFVRPVGRMPIRVPVRLPARSPFRPGR